MYRFYNLGVDFNNNLSLLFTGWAYIDITVTDDEYGCFEDSEVEIGKLTCCRFKSYNNYGKDFDCLPLYKQDWSDDMKEKVEEAILADYKIYRQWHEEETRERRKKLGKYFRR